MTANDAESWQGAPDGRRIGNCNPTRLPESVRSESSCQVRNQQTLEGIRNPFRNHRRPWHEPCPFTIHRSLHAAHKKAATTTT